MLLFVVLVYVSFEQEASGNYQRCCVCDCEYSPVCCIDTILGEMKSIKRCGKYGCFVVIDVPKWIVNLYFINVSSLSVPALLVFATVMFVCHCDFTQRNMFLSIII